MPQQSRKNLVEDRANRPNKFEERRKELAAAALAALSENGYANTSLRDIAAKSGFALGTLHYYFADKVDLIAFCTRVYKLDFIDTYNQLITDATTLDQLINDFVDCAIQSVATNSKTHRLWYDIKSQALFEDEFIDSVEEVDAMLADMVNNMVIKGSELSGKEIALSSMRVYWMLDSFFQHYLRQHLANDADALKDYKREIESFLMWLLK